MSEPKACPLCGAQHSGERKPFVMPQWLVDRFESLEGEKKHYCPEWDGLPIDETCPEFEFCDCDEESYK